MGWNHQLVIDHLGFIVPDTSKQQTSCGSKSKVSIETATGRKRAQRFQNGRDSGVVQNEPLEVGKS